MRKLAAIGSHGVNPNNSNRDILNSFCKKRCSDFVVDLGVESTADSMLYPHELFWYLHENYPNHFAHHLGAKPEFLQQFWTRLKATPLGSELVATHPHLRDRTDFRYVIPISLHFDAGPYSKDNSVMVLSWGGATRHATGNEAFCRFLIGTWVKECGVSARNNKVWRELQHSFKQLSKGRFTGTYGNGKRAKRGHGATKVSLIWFGVASRSRAGLPGLPNSPWQPSQLYRKWP